MSDVTNRDLLQVQRIAHFEQAKAHLRAMLATYYSENDVERAEFVRLYDRVFDFIAYLEEDAPGIA